jgi:hypothetical protein
MNVENGEPLATADPNPSSGNSVTWSLNTVPLPSTSSATATHLPAPPTAPGNFRHPQLPSTSSPNSSYLPSHSRTFTVAPSHFSDSEDPSPLTPTSAVSASATAFLNFKGGDCLVCYSSYHSDGHTTPVFFQCGHSICKRCSERLQEPCPHTFAVSRKKVRCPTCFTYSPFPLVKNYELINLLEANTLGNQEHKFAVGDDQTSEPPKICENCEASAAEKYCVNCAIAFCHSCDESIHRSNAMRRHTRGDIQPQVSLVPSLYALTRWSTGCPNRSPASREEDV